MDVKKLTLLGFSVSLVLVLAGGCPLAAPSRTNNQGGGNLLSAGLKFAGDDMTDLTADEIQIATDFVIEQSEDLPEDVEPLTDEQAAALVIFLNDNDIDSMEDIQRLLDNPQDIIISPEVLAVLDTLEDINFDEFDFDSVL